MTYRKLSAGLLYGVFGVAVTVLTLGFKILADGLGAASRGAGHLAASGTTQLERLKVSE